MSCLAVEQGLVPQKTGTAGKYMPHVQGYFTGLYARNMYPSSHTCRAPRQPCAAAGLATHQCVAAPASLHVHTCAGLQTHPAEAGATAGCRCWSFSHDAGLNITKCVKTNVNSLTLQDIMTLTLLAAVLTLA
jgi:hypothetical protein